MGTAGALGVLGERKPHPQSVDGRIASIAVRQDGVISHRQLLGLGLRKGAIRSRLRLGHLHFVFRGVYSVGVPATSLRSRWAAALLSTEPSFLSHRSGVEFHGLLASISGPVHLTISHSRRALSRPGIVVHRTRRLHGEERWRRGPIAVTSPARTLVDVAATSSERELTRAFDESQRRGLTSPAAILRACERSGGRPGVGLLRSLAAGPQLPMAATRSPPEARFLRFCRIHGLPIPAVNVPLLGYEVDCLWRDARLIVELDSGFHDNPAARDADAERDGRLAVAGYLTYRLRDRRLAARPDQVAHELGALREQRIAAIPLRKRGRTAAESPTLP